jgi:DNA recombination protein RmuC
METVILVLSVVIAVCGIATLAYVVKQGHRETLDGEELKRVLSEQKDEVLRQMQMALSEQEDDILRQIQMVREELTRTMRELLAENRMELSGRVEDLRKEVAGNQALQLQQIQETLNRNLLTTNELQREKLEAMTRQQEQLVKTTEKRLDDMRLMVEEKLQKTLNERIGQSFELVRTQLENVQQGLGEMKSLAQDVGGLKRVLTNVKTRGTFGEVQLAALLEQMLSPEQYEANVKTKKKGTEFVEFAIKLPGKDGGKEPVYLPIDAKFPKDVYEQYVDAYEAGDVSLMETTSKQLEITLKRMAKDIHDKYIEPPYTTDFAILFLPFENIYAEVIRRTSLVETLQKDYKIIVTGPTTLGAILNSLQMGFRTLAIQKRTSEVWSVLGAVKTEFGKFGGMLEKVQKNLQSAGDQLEEVMGKRTRAIERKLRQVEALPAEESRKMISFNELMDEDD